jgi:hypothetical protein
MISGGIAAFPRPVLPHTTREKVLPRVADRC